jgi:hypothetical protein
MENPNDLDEGPSTLETHIVTGVSILLVMGGLGWLIWYVCQEASL